MTTPDHLPRIPETVRSAADVERLWRALMGPWGFGRRSLWILLLDGEHVTKQLLQIDDCDGIPDAELDGDALQQMLRVMAESADRPVFAFLRSRPGVGSPDASDRGWISMAYAASRATGLPCEVVHLAHDRDVLPVPMDDLAA